MIIKPKNTIFVNIITIVKLKNIINRSNIIVYGVSANCGYISSKTVKSKIYPTATELIDGLFMIQVIIGRTTHSRPLNSLEAYCI